MFTLNLAFILVVSITYKIAYMQSDGANLPHTSISNSIENHRNLALLPESCGRYSTYYTIPGRNALLSEFPWMALIFTTHEENMKFVCSGTVISHKYILTSAHCVTQNVTGVRVGEHNIKTELDCEIDGDDYICHDDVQDLAIEEIITHEDLGILPDVKNDIALVRVEHPVNLTVDNADAVCLPLTDELVKLPAPGLQGYITGWDLVGLDIEPSILHRAVGSLVDSSACGELSKSKLNTINKEFCTGRRRKHDCFADSGSPFTVARRYKVETRYIQYGIISGGPIFCDTEKPSRFTDVSKYVGWILDNIKP